MRRVQDIRSPQQTRNSEPDSCRTSVATWDDSDDSDADELGYETESDSHFGISDAEAHTPTFSNNRRLSADPPVVMIAK